MEEEQNGLVLLGGRGVIVVDKATLGLDSLVTIGIHVGECSGQKGLVS